VVEANLPRGSAAGLRDILGSAKVHGHLASSIAGLGVPGGKFGSPLNHRPGDLRGGRAVVVCPAFCSFRKRRAHDHMASGKPVGVKPEVARARHLEREVVIVTSTLSHQNLEAFAWDDAVSGIGHGAR
jgi:hypothetical protein